MANPASKEVVANLKIGGRTLLGDEWIALVNDTLDKNVDVLLNDMAVDLVDEFGRLAPVGATGSLASGITILGVEQKEDGLYKLEILFKEEYTDYVDKGVLGINPSKSKTTLPNREGRKYKFKKYGMPEDALTKLQDWARAKNIQLKAEASVKASKSKSGKYKPPKTKLRETNSGAKSLAYIIKKNGIKASNFQMRAFKNVAPAYQSKLEALGFNSLLIKVAK
jgi:hypothetical protein